MKKITFLICMIGLVTQANAQVEKLSGPRFGFYIYHRWFSNL